MTTIGWNWANYSRCINLKLEIKHDYLNLLKDNNNNILSMIGYTPIWLKRYTVYSFASFLADLSLHDPQTSRHSRNPRIGLSIRHSTLHAEIPSMSCRSPDICLACLHVHRVCSGNKRYQKMLCNTPNTFIHSEATETRLTLHWKLMNKIIWIQNDLKTHLPIMAVATMRDHKHW